MTETLLQLTHWTLTKDADGICWAEIDKKGASQNTLSREVGAEARQIFEHVEELAGEGAINGLVIVSGKESSFIAGADIDDFETLTTVKEVEDEIRPVVEGLDRLEASPVPVVAAISGYCLGGGLELAMACHYRIAVDDDAAKIGLPETQLGIFPGLNGTVRMIRLAGPVAGMEAMLKGRMMSPRRARAMGIIDELVPNAGELRLRARRAVLENKRAGKAPWFQRQMTKWPMRGILAGQMRKQTAEKVREEHYPSPFRLIDLFEQYGGDPERMKREETKLFAPLLLSETSRNLRRVFRLSEMLKAEAGEEKFSPQRAHVIGAGTMGGDIAGVCVLAGMDVSLQDQSTEQIRKARERCEALFRKRLDSDEAVTDAMNRLMADPRGDHVARADLVIEAIIENLDIKRAVFAGLEPKLKPDAVLATNTSSLPLEEIAASLKDPGRLIGLHFFNPVPLMPLVEVVRGAQSREDDIRRGCGIVVKLGKFPLVVKSSPGFLVNRVLAPYLFAAMKAYEKGHSKEKIDAAAEQFGMFMGPVEVADNVGLDVCLHVAEMLGYSDDQGPEGARLVAEGKLGKKTGAGFYEWKNGKPVKRKAEFSRAELDALAEELVAPLIAECEKCVAEGIVETADHADAGIVFGTGFAPFRGGPMHFNRRRKEMQRAAAE